MSYKTKETKEVEAKTKSAKKASQPARDYNDMLVRASAGVMLVALSYNGAFKFLQTVGNSSIKDSVFKIVAAVIVVLLVIVTVRKK